MGLHVRVFYCCKLGLACAADAFGRQLDSVLAFLCVANEQSLSLLQIFKRPDEVGIRVLRTGIEYLFREQLIAPPITKSLKDVILYSH